MISINVSGELRKVIDSTSQSDQHQRFSLQMLIEPEETDLNQEESLLKLKLPKGTFPKEMEQFLGKKINVPCSHYRPAGKNYFYLYVNDASNITLGEKIQPLAAAK